MGFLKVREVSTVQGYETAEQVVKAIFDGTYRSNCLVPVRDEFQESLGAAVWICADKLIAERKRGEVAELSFTIPEFITVADTARSGMDALRGIIEGKRCFGGVIEEGGYVSRHLGRWNQAQKGAFSDRKRDVQESKNRF